MNEEQQTLGVLALSDYVVAARARELLRNFNRVSDDVARKHGLTPQRYLLLLLIKGAAGGRERAGIAELAARARLAESTVVELVDRAKASGFVADGDSDDLRLTEDGERLLARALAEIIPARQELTSDLVRLQDGQLASRQD